VVPERVDLSLLEDCQELGFKAEAAVETFIHDQFKMLAAVLVDQTVASALAASAVWVATVAAVAAAVMGLRAMGTQHPVHRCAHLGRCCGTSPQVLTRSPPRRLVSGLAVVGKPAVRPQH
jgi:hypothetical protein